jgi:hypothetical protein
MPKSVKLVGIASVPRFGPTMHSMVCAQALASAGIPVHYSNSPFWSHGMDELLTFALNSGADYVMTIDYDSMFAKTHVDHMLSTISHNPDIDAVCPLQAKRFTNAVMGMGVEGAEIDSRGLLKAESAHFGLTVFSIAALGRTPRPWFHSRPAFNGTWKGEGKIDDDMFFWAQWKNGGNNVYIDHRISIGHMEELVSVVDMNGECVRIPVDDFWRMYNVPEEQAEPPSMVLCGDQRLFKFDSGI